MTDITWVDGDSGTIDGREFRLANVDAAETSPVGDRAFSARCEQERQAGIAAHKFISSFTRNDNVQITRDYGTDRYGRVVLDLAVGKSDVGETGIWAGHLQDWRARPDGSFPEKPDWCSN